MSPTVQIALLIVVPTCLFVALLRLPRWFARSILRHRLWAVRDQITLDMIDGKLPKGHPAVKELHRTAEWLIRETNGLFTMPSFYVWSLLLRRSESAIRASMHEPKTPATGLTPEQRRCIRTYRDELLNLTGSSLLFGSWIGVLHAIRFLVPALREERRRAHRCDAPPPLEAEIRMTFNTAAARVGDTRLGQRSREFIERESDGHLTTA